MATRAGRAAIPGALLLSGAVCACGGDGANPTTAGSSDSPLLSGAGDPGTLVGTFQVKLSPANGALAATTAVFGKVYDGETPQTVVWENPEVDGECTLTTPRVPFCSTPCGGSAACVEDDRCEPYPAARSVGAVSVSGLHAASGGASFVMNPIVNSYQPPAGVTLEYPPFGEGEVVTFSAAGDYFAPFALESQGLLPLSLDAGAINLSRGEPMELRWGAGANAGATIHVKLDISHHGGTKGQIECDTSDSGSLTISAALISRLIDLGVAGYPSVIVTRHVTGSTLLAAGRVDLEVASVVEQGVSVEGLVSCTDDRNCATGQSCLSDSSCG